MKLSIMFLGIALLGTVTAARVDAQQPATPKDPHHPDTPGASAPATQPAQPASAPGGMMSMEMCHQMMMGHKLSRESSRKSSWGPAHEQRISRHPLGIP